MRISAIANVSGPWAAFAVGVVAAVSPIGPSGMGLAGQSVAGLPHADSKTFLTLEAYLQHLKSLAPIDVPHYLEVSPGLYELQPQYQAPGQKQPRFTRDELERKFGFTR